MSKANMVIVEAIMDNKEIKEISFIEVQHDTYEVRAAFTVKMNDGVFTRREIADIARKMLDGRKVVSYYGMDETIGIINGLFRSEYGYPFSVARENIVDIHILIRRYERKRLTLKEAVEYYGKPTLSTENSTQKARMTYSLLKVIFNIKSIRQFTYIKSVPCFIPEPRG